MKEGSTSMLNQPIKPMLLQPAATPPNGSEWISQVKYDGFRSVMHYDHGKILLHTRHLTPCSKQFPEILNVKLNAKTAILDGEIICLDEQARPDWEKAMARFQASKEVNIQRLSNTSPSIFMAFDILYLDGVCLLHTPLEKRLELLSQTVEQSDQIAVVSSQEDSMALFEATKQLQLEGIVSKRRDSVYTLDSRPQNCWYKVKHYLYEEVEIAGIRRDPFGWILTQDGGKVYKGLCEFVPPKERLAFAKIARQIIRKEEKNTWYLEPVLKCKVKSQGYTKSSHLLRTPSFVEFVF
jgi:DNA ligase 1